jgi:signal transduction histidine kinase/CheY-like chemotaxis protein/HPt (histidine-containing phosphotransfer) domain-containing protein
MLQSRFKYLVLIIFLASVVLIVFLQYNSGNSIKNLIRDNQSLLNELQIKNKLQRFQTDIIFGESALRDLVASDDPAHVLETDKDLKRIRNEFTEIDNTIRPTSDTQLLDRLKFLVTEKLENSNDVIKILFEQGKDSALAFIRTLRGRIIRDSIIQTIALINGSRQKTLSDISTSVNTNGAKAKSWGIILAIVACLASLVTLWYLVVQGQRQQKLIRTLDTSEKKLKEASKIQEQFVANISHEIRTPMNAILGFAGLLQKTGLDKNQHEYVRSIRSSAENLLTIINDILDLSRIESGMMHIEYLPFNVRELLDSLTTMMNVKAKSRNLYLRTEIDPSIPGILNGDAVRLTQILINLLSNALKFTHEGGVTIKAEYAEKKNDIASVRFVISDTGIGIEPAKQKTIFERFHQAQPETTRRYGGTGLGLSIVKQLVEIQNGTISIDSEPGKGSIFTVVLPYQISNETEAAKASALGVLAAEPLLKKIKILVAEDNSMNQKLLQHLLSQWQIDFDMVNNGAEAVSALEQESNDYAMVLMDIQMPEMDGYTATEKIRHDLNRQIPIVAMTAHALAGEKEKCLGAGMDDYISKPLNEEQLYKLINKYAQAKSARDTSVIDLEYLKIVSKGDEGFEKNMIRSFSVQIPEELNKLKSSIIEKDYEQIRSIAHNMKSTLSFMGLKQLTPLLQQIEQDCKKQNGFNRISDNFTLISATCQLALIEAKELIS